MNGNRFTKVQIIEILNGTEQARWTGESFRLYGSE